MFARREPEHLRTGRWGERRAAKWLRRRGYRICGRRVRAGRRGELDIVARDGETLVFVEVKTRRSRGPARPAASVNRRKRRTLRRAALSYLKRMRPPPRYFRFDVIEVIGPRGTRRPEIRHIRGALSLRNDQKTWW
ncbi:YraN family protein [Kiritimatiella glycovorans]|uniref:UPF0102 protein L21SP4_00108 n=1 Tax=Kiritimatiella glycovorans TaxID=1307763 RepID=A0A0G3EGY7_9BACT|nr:YraN family protein [Kiritimatiella glycovorans]AKJ63394.1 hypothetical protein L21SP4_00108 [Kiritimatiella glycovorans]